MNILFLGDIVGRSGRKAVCDNLLKIKKAEQEQISKANKVRR
jgi:calcineurin-like phosphoesterase